jgi:hypothetical protein
MRSIRWARPGFRVRALSTANVNAARSVSVSVTVLVQCCRVIKANEVRGRNRSPRFSAFEAKRGSPTPNEIAENNI